MSLVAFYTSWKHKKPRGFPIFSGGIERDHWCETGRFFNYNWKKTIFNLRIKHVNSIF